MYQRRFSRRRRAIARKKVAAVIMKKSWPRYEAAIKKALPKHVALRYVHYNDQLNPEQVAAYISGDADKIQGVECDLLECFDTYDGYLGYLMEVKQDTGLPERVFDYYSDDIRFMIEDADTSDPITDLINNTGDVACIYTVPFDPEDDKDAVRQLMKMFKIKKEQRKAVQQLVACGDGGGLEIFFELNSQDIKVLIDAAFGNQIPPSITFENCSIGLVNHWHGSGDCLDLPGSKITVPLIPSRIRVEKTLHYSWSYEIAGMCHGWQQTSYKFGNDKITFHIDPAGDNALAAMQARQDKYNATFKAGGCTHGDMDITRHRNKQYINSYPCGTHCKDCKTFWID